MRNLSVLFWNSFKHMVALGLHSYNDLTSKTGQHVVNSSSDTAANPERALKHKYEALN